jgi:cytidine deaminase
VNEIMKNKLIAVMEKAYCPYSDFKVGAIVITEDGSEYDGCNIENGAYSATCCAERVAIFKAISDGHTKINQIHIMADTFNPVSPCGVCRQVMSEFMSGEGQVFLYNKNGDIKKMTLEDILPYRFDLRKDAK